MAFGVFLHKDGSNYFDIPEVHYQFPKIYLSRAEQMVDDWIIYYEPLRPAPSKGFFAVAKVERIIRDPDKPDHFRALIEKGSYIEFEPTVPHRLQGQLVERGLANAQAAVRILNESDFARIISLGLPVDETLPRVGDLEVLDLVQDPQMPFAIERPIVQTLLNRPFRDRAFRRAVLHAYDGRCAVTGWRLVNGGGRLEAEAAHIRPVEHGGPDSVRNGLALSGTAHWMFDRGLIGLSNDLEILVSRQVNDPESIEAVINPTRKAIVPANSATRPHPMFLEWHRENCFKN